MFVLFKRYFLYLVRWQLSTPILAFCLVYFAATGEFWSTVIANFLGGLIFFWVDRFIFTSRALGPIWHVEEKVVCADCGTVDRGYRLVRSSSGKYDKTNEESPKFRCHNCSQSKYKTLKAEGKI